MSKRRVNSVGSPGVPGVRVRSDGSHAFVAWRNSEAAASDVDGYLGIWADTDANFLTNGVIVPAFGHGYLNLVHVGDSAVTTPPTVLVLGRILPSTDGISRLKNLPTDFAADFINNGPIVPLRELGADVGTETFTLSGTKGQSTDYHVSDISRVYVGSVSEIAVLVTSAASIAGGVGCIIGWFSS